MSKEISQKQKSRILEGAVLAKTPKEVLKVMGELGAVAFTSRAIGLACRYRGLDMVKALVDGGARFDNYIGTNHDRRCQNRISQRFRKDNPLFPDAP